uniref:ShKT domain-containing protein n=1 Tax=Panagrellus redivivus TaxID=6233 RepID=A0A7E4VU56_PANRE
MYIFGFIACFLVIHEVGAQIWQPERRGYPISSYGEPYEQEYQAPPYLESPIYPNYPPTYASPSGINPFQRRPPAYGVGVAPTAYPGQMGVPMMAGGVGGMPLGSRAQEVAVASLMNYVTDKDNFQPQGCSWDGGRNRCTDVLNQCKGICRDFANDVVTHDCRCVPFGYAALLGWQN